MSTGRAAERKEPWLSNRTRVGTWALVVGSAVAGIAIGATELGQRSTKFARSPEPTSSVALASIESRVSVLERAARVEQQPAESSTEIARLREQLAVLEARRVEANAVPTSESTQQAPRHPAERAAAIREWFAKLSRERDGVGTSAVSEALQRAIAALPDAKNIKQFTSECSKAACVLELSVYDSDAFSETFPLLLHGLAALVDETAVAVNTEAGQVTLGISRPGFSLPSELQR